MPMRISRLYFPEPLCSNTSVEISGQPAHYLHRVLRLKVGDSLHLFNEHDGEYAVKVTSINRANVTVQIDCAIEGSSNPILDIHLGLGLSRGERMDYAIQKSTELGVSAITPLITERSEVKINPDRLEKKLSHWRNILVSASEQCGRTSIPQIHSPVHIDNWLRSTQSNAESNYRVLLDHRGVDRIIRRVKGDKADLITKVFLCIGPEGGFSETETTLAQELQFVIARIGPRVLRTETAPVSAISIIQYVLGDF